MSATLSVMQQLVARVAELLNALNHLISVLLVSAHSPWMGNSETDCITCFELPQLPRND